MSSQDPGAITPVSSFPLGSEEQGWFGKLGPVELDAHATHVYILSMNWLVTYHCNALMPTPFGSSAPYICNAPYLPPCSWCLMFYSSHCFPLLAMKVVFLWTIQGMEGVRGGVRARRDPIDKQQESASVSTRDLDFFF